MKKIVFTIALILSLGLNSNVWAEGNRANEVNGNNNTTNTTVTAVLPITARSSEAARLLEGKHLNNKKLKQLFFLNDDFDEDVKKKVVSTSLHKTFETITIYSGSNATQPRIWIVES